MVIMAKYTNMVTTQKRKSRDLITTAIGEINQMLKDDEKVTVAELVKRTGCCRAFFYTNREVHEAFINAQEKQTGKIFVKPQKAILDEAIKKENIFLKQKIQKLEAELLQYKEKEQRNLDKEFDLIANL